MTASVEAVAKARSLFHEIWRCAHCGHVFTTCSGKKFGTANSMTISAVAMIAMIRELVK